MALRGEHDKHAIAMRRKNTLWLHQYFVRPIIEEARKVPLAHWPLVAAETRKRMIEDGFYPEEIAYVEDEIRHAMDLSADRCWWPPEFCGFD